MEELKIVLQSVLGLLDQEDKTDEALEILEQALATVTLVRIGTESLSKLRDIFEHDNISQEELRRILDANSIRLEAAYDRAKNA